jgi:hypothetical protein
MGLVAAGCVRGCVAQRLLMCPPPPPPSPGCQAAWLCCLSGAHAARTGLAALRRLQSPVAAEAGSRELLAGWKIAPVL